MRGNAERKCNLGCGVEKVKVFYGQRLCGRRRFGSKSLVHACINLCKYEVLQLLEYEVIILCRLEYFYVAWDLKVGDSQGWKWYHYRHEKGGFLFICKYCEEYGYYEVFQFNSGKAGKTTCIKNLYGQTNVCWIISIVYL